MKWKDQLCPLEPTLSPCQRFLSYTRDYGDAPHNLLTVKSNFNSIPVYQLDKAVAVFNVTRTSSLVRGISIFDLLAGQRSMGREFLQETNRDLVLLPPLPSPSPSPSPPFRLGPGSSVGFERCDRFVRRYQPNHGDCDGGVLCGTLNSVSAPGCRFFPSYPDILTTENSHSRLLRCVPTLVNVILQPNLSVSARRADVLYHTTLHCHSHYAFLVKADEVP